MIRVELAVLEREVMSISERIKLVAGDMRSLSPRQLREDYLSARQEIAEFEGKVLACDARSEQEFPAAKRYLDICDNLRKQILRGYQEARR